MGNSTWPPSIQMGVTAGIFLASILLKEMRYLVYIRYLCLQSKRRSFTCVFQVVFLLLPYAGTDRYRLVYLEALFAAKAELQRFTEIISL